MTEHTAPPTAASPPSGSALARLAAMPALRSAVLLVLAAIAFLPGFFSIPPVDRDEARYAQASKQMLESGDFADIRFQDDPRHKKPIGIYWIQAATVAAIGPEVHNQIWAYRLPSLVAATVLILLIPWCLRPLVGAEAGLLAAILLGGCVMLGAEARLAKTDAALLLAIVVMQGALARLWLQRDGPAPAEAPGPAPPLGWTTPLVFWAALGLGILIKGPVAPVVAGGTILVLVLLERRLAWLVRLRPLAGLPLLALIVAPWLVSMFVLADGGFDAGAMEKDILGKIWSGQESHGAPPGSYLLAFWLTFWPFSLLTALALPWIWRNRHEPGVRFALAWIVPTWLLFELSVTKLPHYVLPTYPAIAALTAAALLDPAQLERRARWPVWLGSALWGAASLALPLALVGLPLTLGLPLDPLAVAVAVLALALAGLAWHRLVRVRLPLVGFGLLLTTGLLLSATVHGRLFPSLGPIWLAPALESAIRRVVDCDDPVVASSGFREPSLVFTFGTATRLVGPAENASFLLGDDGISPSATCRVSIVDARFEPAFMAAVDERGFAVRRVGEVAGFNFNGGDDLDLGLYVWDGAP